MVRGVVVVREGDALLSHCKGGDRVYGKVAAVGGDTDEQPFTEVLTRLVQQGRRAAWPAALAGATRLLPASPATFAGSPLSSFAT